MSEGGGVFNPPEHDDLCSSPPPWRANASCPAQVSQAVLGTLFQLPGAKRDAMVRKAADKFKKSIQGFQARRRRPPRPPAAPAP